MLTNFEQFSPVETKNKTLFKQVKNGNFLFKFVLSFLTSQLIINRIDIKAVWKSIDFH